MHYNYDSFLFDYNKADGVETIHEIKKILEQDGFITKTKVGHDYGDIKKYEFNLDSLFIESGGAKVPTGIPNIKNISFGVIERNLFKQGNRLKDSR